MKGVIPFLVFAGLVILSAVPSARAASLNYDLDVNVTPIGRPWQGYYTNLDQITFMIVVRNPTNNSFPGGYLVGQVQSYSSKWFVPQNFTLPAIEPKKSANFSTTFSPQEPGVYIITLQSLTVKCATADYCSTKIQSGFAAINVEDVQTLYAELVSVTGIIGILSAILVVFVQVRLNRRTLDEMVKQRKAQAAVVVSYRLGFEGPSEGQRMILGVKNGGPGSIARGVMTVVAEGIRGAPNQMKFDIPSLGAGDEEVLHLGVSRSILTGTETVRVTLQVTDVMGERQNLGTKILGLAGL